MITFQRLARFVFAEPFRPFRIRMAGGQVLDITDPDSIHIGKTMAFVSFLMSEDPELVKEQYRHVLLAQMESIELLDVATMTEGK